MSAKCDFCSAPDPPWCYPAEQFEVPAALWGSVGAWSACEDCSALIDTGDYARLAKRGLASYGPIPDHKMRRVALVHVRQLHRQFMRARNGPRRPFG